MSEEFSVSTESIMAEALAAKGTPPTEQGTPSASELIEGAWTRQADGTMRSGAFTNSQTQDIMASALVAAGRLTPEQAAEAARTGEVAEDAGVEPASAPIDANPWRTAQAAEAFAIGAGIEPGLAKFYSGRIEKALQQPAISLEAQRQSTIDTHNAMVEYFGDEAEGYADVARRELALLARDHPNLPAILERTNLGNDMHLVKSLIARAADRALKARGYKS